MPHTCRRWAKMAGVLVLFSAAVSRAGEPSRSDGNAASGVTTPSGEVRPGVPKPAAVARNVARAAQSLVNKARERFDRGVADKDAQSLAQALDALTFAYWLSPEPELLLALAQVERRLLLCAEAREHYARYLGGTVSPQGRVTAEHHLQALDACEPEVAPGDEAARPALQAPRAAALGQASPVVWEELLVSTPEHPASSAPRERVGPWLLLGAGGLSTAVAGAFWLEVASAKQSFDTAPTAARAIESAERGKVAQRNGALFLALGVALGGAAGAWYMLDEPPGEQGQPPPSTPAVGLLPLRSGGGLELWGSF